MAIMIVLLGLYLFGAIALLVALILSLTIGCTLYVLSKRNILIPIFTIVIPATAIAAMFGGILGIYVATEFNNYLLFYGPLGGILIGSFLGFLIGSVLSGFWWFQRGLFQ